MEIVANRRPLAKDSTRSPTIVIIICFGIGVLLYCDAGFAASMTAHGSFTNQCEASKQADSWQTDVPSYVGRPKHPSISRRRGFGPDNKQTELSRRRGFGPDNNFAFNEITKLLIIVLLLQAEALVSGLLLGRRSIA